MRDSTRKNARAWSLWRALAIIFLVWLVAVVVLAALETLREMAAPAGPAAPQATPRTNTHALAINCHQGVPPTQSPYLAVAHAAALKYRVDSLTFEWQIMQESGYQPTVTSPAGAEGIAQFMPDTARGLGIDPWNPRQALAGTAKLDAAHLKQYASKAQSLAAHYGANEERYDYGLALAAYNDGPGATNWA